jgi:DNA-binding winged helix-turn-helix (wHTH) protein/TolB-like protein/Flp pilus assembly protein TadD
MGVFPTMVQCELAFGRFRLQPGRQLLLDGEPVALGAKPLNVLSTLVEAHGNLVTKDELIEQVWPGLVVEENTLQAHISALRKVLGEDGRWIATVPGRGYRFAGPLEAANDTVESPESPAPIAVTRPPEPPASPVKSRRPWPIIAAGVVLVLVVATGWGTWRWTHSPQRQAVRPERYLVLPFVNRTGDPHEDDFADALTDAVAARIAAQSWDSEVVGHNKAFAYKGQPINDEKLAQQLDLTFIVEGSVLPSENDLQSSATIVDARTGTQIATVTAKAPKGLPEIERQWLAVGLVEQARWNIFRQQERLVAADKPNDDDIRNLLVRAESALDEQSLGSWDVAAPLIDKALAIDPHDVHALCVYSQLRIQFVTAFDFKDEADRTRMLNEADRALTEAARIDPTRTTVHLMLGDLRSAQGRHEAARAEYQRVLELDPLNASGLDALAMEDIYFGEPEAALPKLEQARSINPEDAYLIDGDVAIMRVTLGQDAEALAAIRKAVTVDSSDPWVWMYLAALLQLNGRHDEAQAALSTLRRLNPTVTIAKIRLADTNASPRYRQSQERLYAALEEIGLAEGSSR